MSIFAFIAGDATAKQYHELPAICGATGGVHAVRSKTNMIQPQVVTSLQVQGEVQTPVFFQGAVR